MTFTIVTFSSPEWSELAALTEGNKALYCARHRYDLLTFHGPWKLGVAWARIADVAALCRSHPADWLFFMGADTLITNFNVKLESLIDDKAHVIIANDCNGWNMDVMLIRCSPEAAAYFDYVLSTREQFVFAAFMEQSAMIAAAPKFPGLFKEVPQRTFNSYDYTLWGRAAIDCRGNDGQWQPGDFVFHAPGLPYEKKLETIKRILPQVIQ